MKTYEEWAKDIVRQYGIHGGQKLINELQKAITLQSSELDRYMDNRQTQTKSNNIGFNSTSHQISSIESGNITHR